MREQMMRRDTKIKLDRLPRKRLSDTKKVPVLLESQQHPSAAAASLTNLGPGMGRAQRRNNGSSATQARSNSPASTQIQRETLSLRVSPEGTRNNGDLSVSAHSRSKACDTLSPSMASSDRRTNPPIQGSIGVSVPLNLSPAADAQPASPLSLRVRRVIRSSSPFMRASTSTSTISSAPSHLPSGAVTPENASGFSTTSAAARSSSLSRQVH